MSNNIQNQAMNNPQNMGFYQQPIQDDEIDLRELIKVIWDYKWLTVVMCAIAIAGSSFHALNAQEWWAAKGKVIAPQVTDVASLYSQTKRVSSILKAVDSSDSSVLRGLFEPSTLLNMFVNQFNSSLKKKEFLEKNPEFLNYLKTHEIKMPGKEVTAENQLKRNSYHSVLNAWAKEVTATKDSKTNSVDLSFKTTTQASSAQLLNDYIEFISKEVKNNQFEKFILFVNSSKKDLSISIQMAKANAKNQLLLELKKAQYAYKIAEKGGIKHYQVSLNSDEELFKINKGSKALKVQVEVLKSIKDFSLLDPQISRKQTMLDTLNNLKLTDDKKFTPFRYLEVVEAPLNRAAPKRALIVVLATLLAGMLSIFIALVHHFMTKKED